MNAITAVDVDLLGRRLRALQSVVEFLDEQGVDLPAQPYITSHSHSGNTCVAWYLGGDDQTTHAAAILRIVGGKWDKSDSNETLYFRQTRGDVQYVVSVDREAVCERVVKGTRQVTVPAVKAQPERVETVEDVEWVCGSLLAEAVSS